MKRPTVQITILPEVLARLDALAARLGLSRSGAVAHLVREARVQRAARGPRS